MVGRRSLVGFGVVAGLVGPWARVQAGAAGQAGAGVTDDEIVLGTSAAFSGPSRGLGIELYRGAMAYFEHINGQGGVRGRQVVLKLYDDGYQPDPCVNNTQMLMREDRVFLLFGYVGHAHRHARAADAQEVPRPGHVPVLSLYRRPAAARAALWRLCVQLARLVPPRDGRLGRQLRSRGPAPHRPVFYQADAYGRSGWAGVRAALRKHGLSMVGEATYRRGEKFTGTMRRQVDILKEAQPDAVICIGAYAACAAFARDAVDLGLPLPIANLSFVGSENLLKLLSDGQRDSRRYTDWLVNSQVVPSYEDVSIPAVKEYRTLMAHHNPEPPALVQESYTPFRIAS